MSGLRDFNEDDPLRVYIGGDSLADVYGQNFAERLAESGKVSTYVDSRPSSGLVNTKFFDWNKQAKSITAKYEPELFFFIIGTNDASIVKSNPEDYESLYIEKLVELTDNLSTSGQPIYFILAPNMKDPTLNKNVVKLNKVIKMFASSNSYEVIDSGDVLSPKEVFTKSIDGKTIRTNDGVHITNEGGDILSKFIYSSISSLIDLTNSNNLPALKVTLVPGCCKTPASVSKPKTYTTKKTVKSTTPSTTSTSPPTTTDESTPEDQSPTPEPGIPEESSPST